MHGMGLEPTTMSSSSPADLQERLTRRSGKKVLLMVTDNTSTMLTLQREGKGLVSVRAHRMFLHAPEEVCDALADWIAGRTRERDRVQEFIDANVHRIRPPTRAPRPPRVRTMGKHHDLDELARHLNATLLDGRSTAEVGWGRKVTARNARQIRLGSYDPVRNRITISQRLDRRDIPRYMVEYVLFHEMLHEVLGIGERPDGRRDIHSRIFRLMEETFPHYEQARAFERKKWGGA